jgi:hypothetical protein
MGELVRQVVDASDPEADFGHAANTTDQGYAVSYHVTDDPSGVEQALVAGVKVTAKHKGTFQDLGPGFYVSAAPQLWMGRARSKWEFLKRLDKRQRHRLAVAILRHPHMRESGYLTKFEKGYVVRDLRSFVDSGYGDIIVGLAGQPYNIRFWEPEFLAPLGIEPGRQPTAVEVWFRGGYAELTRTPTSREFGRLWAFGFDGAFVKIGMIADPQLVIWKNAAILRFGDLRRAGPTYERRASANPRGRGRRLLGSCWRR